MALFNLKCFYFMECLAFFLFFSSIYRRFYVNDPNKSSGNYFAFFLVLGMLYNVIKQVAGSGS